MKFITPYVTSIENALGSLDLPESPRTLYDPQRYMLGNGGKRIRPVLTLMACGMCGEKRRKAMPAALAVELLHNFTLMHDDIMDQAESRRGKPAVHIKWDESVAILSGDSMHTRALLLLNKLDTSVDYRQINTIFLKGINKVCEGQALDMEFETREDVSLQEYMTMIGGKTGALLEASLQMGGVIAGCNSTQLHALQQIGKNIGHAFQIQDDWLDVVADPDKFGKRVAGDIYECKKTYLMILALERCNKDQKKWLKECLRSKPLQDEDVQSVISLYRELDVIEDARTKMAELYDTAEQSLEIFGESEDKRDLTQLIKTLKKRDH
ncbi:polyprenyl synthetase family protein [Rhodohalobacter sp. 8-1]|uniref:polyprenyl synthetase family protein n=1 Tax=Rhodohalobacter sp. 8-1 TaxID=3131972 RepID=UPI0030EC56CD